MSFSPLTGISRPRTMATDTTTLSSVNQFQSPDGD